jgi:hypothetical protein
LLKLAAELQREAEKHAAELKNSLLHSRFALAVASFVVVYFFFVMPGLPRAHVGNQVMLTLLGAALAYLFNFAKKT